MYKNYERYFSREQKKGSEITKAAYHWGHTDPDNIAACLLSLCEEVRKILSKEQRLLEISAPCYIMGDLHGNYEDLSAFEKVFILLLSFLYFYTLLLAFMADWNGIISSKVFISWRLR